MVSDSPGLFAELKRRHVWRAMVLYIGAVWALAQGISQLTPALGLPDLATRWFLVAAIIGFPFWVAFAWFYEFTPQGIKRESDVAPNASIAHSTARKLDFAIIGVLIVAVALLASGYFIRRHAPDAAAIAAKSIAVLPFENLSGDKDNAYFVAGMQDLILTKLADVGNLKVISRTSTAQYASRPEDLKTVGQQLGVATILEGSVQKAGKQVLINVQLIDTQTDTHIWAESYTRTLDNVFGVEGEVAEQIATSLDARLSPAETARLASDMSANPVASNLFLRAEYQYHRSEISGDIADVKAAIPLYRQAVQADPSFALAWARLSIAESNLAAAGLAGEDSAQLVGQARADAEQALKLQPGLAAAQLAVGYCDYWGRHDYASALKAFTAVLAQRPNDVDALVAQGNVQGDQGRFDAAITSFTKALALDPRNFATTLDLGGAYMSTGRYVDAEKWFQRALALEPDSISAKGSYSQAILLGSGDVERALAVLQGDAPELKLMRAWLLSYQHKFGEELALIESVPDTPGNDALGYSRNIHLAVLYYEAGDQANARKYFAKGLAEDKPLLPKALGLYRAALLNTVGGEEVATGHAATGLAMIAQAEAILDKAGDTGMGPSVRVDDAAVYAMAGRADLAVPVLEKALTSPGIGASYSPLMLWLDPYWDLIRHDAGFQALLKKYAKFKPAVTYDAPHASALPTASR